MDVISLIDFFLVHLSRFLGETESHFIELAHLVVEFGAHLPQTLYKSAQFLDDFGILKLLLELVLASAQAHLLRKV